MIGIIGFNSLKIMPYLSKYTEVLDNNNIEYEVIYWNREYKDDKNPSNYFSFNYKINTYEQFTKKLSGFIRYTNFLYKTIRKKKYDKLILLTTQTIIPLFPLIIYKYKQSYIYDYRDITFEKNLIYKRLVKNLVENSYFTAISSFGFIRQIGRSDKLVMSHNCSNTEIEKNINNKLNEKINVVFWGMVRQVEYNKKICNLFGNDERFNLIYHGEGYYKELESYCRENNYSNISFTGTFEAKDIVSFSQKTDIILNTYENDEKQKLALTVKLYDAMKYKLPMIITKDSYMEEYLRNYDIAYAIDINQMNNLDEIFDWILNIKRELINEQYELLCQKVISDTKYFTKKVIEFASDKK